MHLDFALLSMTELRTRPGEILDRVADGGEMFLIERGGRRRACLVPLSFFFPDVSPSRIAAEMNELTDQGEEPSTSISDSRELAFRFPHKLADGSSVEIEIVLPHGYPNTCPRVYAIPINDTPPHRWQDGALCLYGVMSGWNPGKHTASSTLTLARQWLRHYDAWRQSGLWPKQEGISDE
jgi:antitoxin (DNA-binding transcriptional repressor) of toxin-antitoxin stability system